MTTVLSQILSCRIVQLRPTTVAVFATQASANMVTFTPEELRLAEVVCSCLSAYTKQLLIVCITTHGVSLFGCAAPAYRGEHAGGLVHGRLRCRPTFAPQVRHLVQHMLAFNSYDN
jgi:hypothetical protein